MSCSISLKTLPESFSLGHAEVHLGHLTHDLDEVAFGHVAVVVEVVEDRVDLLFGLSDDLRGRPEVLERLGLRLDHVVDDLLV